MPMRLDSPSPSDIEMAAVDDGQLVLGDLISLGQIRVEIVLAGKHGAARNLHRRQTELDRHATASRSAPAAPLGNLGRRGRPGYLAQRHSGSTQPEKILLASRVGHESPVR